MFSTLTPRFIHYRIFRSWIAIVQAVARVFASSHLSYFFSPHLFHHWDFKARLSALFSFPTSIHLPRVETDALHAASPDKTWFAHVSQRMARFNPLVHLDDRFVPHPGEIASEIAVAMRELWYATLRHIAIFLGGYEQLEIIVKTDNLPKQIIIPGKGKHTIVFGNGTDCQDRKKEYIHVSDDELFHEHLVIGYSRLFGWRIKKMEGEFGCGFQYSTDSLNDSIPLTDCAIMRIGHTSILINIEGKNLSS
ncbi:MAG: hypothetical protein HQL83_03880 [Magnetococcales bacterium]|nr:hypothetical protein [Magnetococcales bacterium]MBF0630214.1 hypothetical protein [Magnetococcales bacterium]